jgi:threonine dehydratase
LAAAVKGAVRVIGVEPENCPTFGSALIAGQPVEVAVGDVAADSLGATRIRAIAWDVAFWTHVESVTFSDDDIVRSDDDIVRSSNASGTRIGG